MKVEVSMDLTAWLHVLAKFIFAFIVVLWRSRIARSRLAAAIDSRRVQQVGPARATNNMSLAAKKDLSPTCVHPVASHTSHHAFPFREYAQASTFDCGGRRKKRPPTEHVGNATRTPNTWYSKLLRPEKTRQSVFPTPWATSYVVFGPF